MDDRYDDGFERTRRAILRASAGLIGFSAVGTTSARPDDPIPGSGPPYDLDDAPFERAAVVGFHSLGGVGAAGTAGRDRQRHDGDRQRAIDVHGDLAAVSFLNSGEEEPGRRLALLDISDFTGATTPAELDEAELSVHAFYRSVNAEATSGHGVRFSADGNYVFLATAAFLPFTDGYHGGSHGSVNPNNPGSKPEVTGGVVALDISNPANPEPVDSLTAPFTTGAYNVDYQRIGGTEYVFATKDFGFFAPDSGIYVLRFDRDTGKLTVVNRWSADGNTVRGGIGAEHGQPGPETSPTTAFSYVADVEVHEDPRTGRPTAYVADWNRGVRVLDVSEPTNIDHVGQFDMLQARAATPFPALVEASDGTTKRVAVANHEEYDERFDQRNDDNFMNPHPNKTNPNSTGSVFLIDCDGIYPEDPAYDGGEDPTRLGELDNWTWANVDTDPGIGFEEIKFKRRQLSPHSPTVTRHETDSGERFVVHQSHFHGGVRYLEIRPGTEDGLTEADEATEGGTGRRQHRSTVNPYFEDRAGDPFGWVNNTTDWDLVEVGHARPENKTIEEEISPQRPTPRVTTAAVAGGVTLLPDQFAGVYAAQHESVPLSAPLPIVDSSRSYSAGPTRTTSNVYIDLSTVKRRDGDAGTVRVRDRIPGAWRVVDGKVETYEQGVRTAVEFETTVVSGEDAVLSYRVKTPDDGVTRGTFGPVEVSLDGDEWVEVEGTISEVTAGPSI